MAGKRGHPPLFELLRETDTDAARLPRAGVISEPKPDSKPDSKPEPEAKPEAGVAAELEYAANLCG